MQPDAESQSWEGGQGTDSFFPYQVGKRWYAFYGSHEKLWEVGLAEADFLAGHLDIVVATVELLMSINAATSACDQS